MSTRELRELRAPPDIERASVLSEVSRPFPRHVVICSTGATPGLVALVATRPPPGFQFDYDSAVYAVYDAPAAYDGP